MLQYLPSYGYEIYALSLMALMLALGAGGKLRERAAAAYRAHAFDDGSSVPASLHPVIDPEKCVGCGACAHACPEGKIIGMIDGKAQLLDPASCIGHGACKTACPVAAIDLVFGTKRHGVDIPLVSPNFESNVPGLYIAGELGGMGLIANAIEQGRQAVEAIAKRDNLGQPGIYDLIIVGGGPAGISASLAAKQKGLRFATLEQETLGGTVSRYPRGKVVMTRPAVLPLFGKVRLRRVRKERLINLWQSVMRKTGLKIHQGVRVDRITPTQWGFEVATSSGLARSSVVLLATGRRGSPRKLDIPGEDLAKVSYYLDDPERYRGQHVLVVGGGDSALETAVELTRHPVASVTLSYRGTAFDHAQPAVRRRFAQALRAGRIYFLAASDVRAIEPEGVVIDQRGRRHALRNDAVIICAGGTLATSLLADVGVEVERKYGTG